MQTYLILYDDQPHEILLKKKRDENQFYSKLWENNVSKYALKHVHILIFRKSCVMACHAWIRLSLKKHHYQELTLRLDVYVCTKIRVYLINLLLICITKFSMIFLTWCTYTDMIKSTCVNQQWRKNNQADHEAFSYLQIFEKLSSHMKFYVKYLLIVHFFAYRTNKYMHSCDVNFQCVPDVAW